MSFLLLPNNLETGLCPKSFPKAVLFFFFLFLKFLLPKLESIACLLDLTKLLAIPFPPWDISFPQGCDKAK